MNHDPDPPIGRAATGSLAVIYDGGCSRCRNAIAMLMARVDRNRIEPIDCRDPQVIRRFPDLGPKRMLASVHAIDDRGRVFVGGQATRQALARADGPLRHLARFWSLPGFGTIAELGYRLVARFRRRDSS